MTNFGSNKVRLEADFLDLIIEGAAGSSSSIGGTAPSGEGGATIGSAKAQGDETEEGVDERVA
jgi:hypothetical protein